MQEKLSDITIDEFRNDMAELRKSNKDQADYAKKTFVMTMISTITIVAVAIFLLVYAAFLIPKIDTLLKDAQASVTNINKITDEIADTDIAKMVGNVNQLVETSQDGVANAIGKMDEINIDQLNRAIKDLTDVIDPLANFFNKFKF